MVYNSYVKKEKIIVVVYVIVAIVFIVGMLVSPPQTIRDKIMAGLITVVIGTSFVGLLKYLNKMRKYIDNQSKILKEFASKLMLKEKEIYIGREVLVTSGKLTILSELLTGRSGSRSRKLIKFVQTGRPYQSDKITIEKTEMVLIPSMFEFGIKMDAWRIEGENIPSDTYLLMLRSPRSYNIIRTIPIESEECVGKVNIEVNNGILNASLEAPSQCGLEVKILIKEGDIEIATLSNKKREIQGIQIMPQISEPLCIILFTSGMNIDAIQSFRKDIINLLGVDTTKAPVITTCDIHIKIKAMGKKGDFSEKEETIIIWE